MPSSVTCLRAVVTGLLLWCGLQVVTAAPSPVSLDAPAPLSGVPEGWLHIPEACIDCWIGAYHDAVSGAYVRYSTMSADEEERYRTFGEKEGEVSTTTGRIADVPYRLQRMLDGRGYMTRRLELSTNTPVAELPSSLTSRILPAAGTPYTVLTILTKPWAWRFEAAVPTKEQEDRVLDLLLAAPRLRPSTSGNVYARSKTLDAGQYQSLRQGMTASDVLGRFARPRSSAKQNATGFVLVYDAQMRAESKDLCEQSLSFDREQRLRRWSSDPTCRRP